MSQSQPFLARVANGSLVIQILVGIIAGVALAVISPSSALSVSFFRWTICCRIKSCRTDIGVYIGSIIDC